MKVIDFNDGGMVESPTAYGTLKTRVLSLELDIRGPEADKISLADLHRMLLDK